MVLHSRNLLHYPMMENLYLVVRLRINVRRDKSERWTVSTVFQKGKRSEHDRNG